MIIRTALRTLVLAGLAGTPESTAAFFAAEDARWGRLIHEIGLEPE